MGAKSKNFYNTLFRQYGYEAEAEEIQDLYLSGKKQEAEAKIPLDFLEATNLVGPESYVKERIEAYRASGVTNLQIMIFRDIRAFRLYDGPTEVHKYAIARQILR